MTLSGKKIAILATHGFEQAELEVPRDHLKKAGATVDVVSLASGEIKGWDKNDWGRPVKVDKTLSATIRLIINKEVPEDDTGLIAYDSYWSVLRENPSFRSVPEIKAISPPRRTRSAPAR